MKSKILHIKTYNRNEHLKSFCKYFWFGFTGKSGNVIDFTWNKDMQKFNRALNRRLYKFLMLIIILCVLFMLFINLS